MPNQKPFTYQYRNHYSQKFGSCFAVVTRTGAFPNMLQQHTRHLYDVVENSQIGMVNWYVDHGVDRGVDGGRGDGAFFCVVNGQHCKSHAEWDALVEQFMEE